MRVTATVSKTGNCYRATCVEMDGAGEGATIDAALTSLRTALADRRKPEGMVLPSQTDLSPIEITVVSKSVDERGSEPSGPGDP